MLRSYRRGDVLSQRLAVHAQAADHLVFDRPACQCIKISLTSITSNVLLANSLPRPGREEGFSFAMASSTTTRTPYPWGIT
jgi:hypothetical protein